MAYPEPLEALIEAFSRFPGIGRRSAERLAFHVLRDPEARGLAGAVERAVSHTRRCQTCGNVTEDSPCEVCADPERDPASICVVEEPRHVETLERAGVWGGRYHVLMGKLNPADGSESAHLAIPALVARVRSGLAETGGGATLEVVLATDPDAEGEATAMAVLEALDPVTAEVEAAGHELRVTRLARGLPAGSAIEYLHRGVLEDALAGRRSIRRR